MPSDTGIIGRVAGGTARLRHRARVAQESASVLSGRRQRDQAEFRQNGIAAADAGNAEEDAAKAFCLGGLLQKRAGIGDGDEMRGGCAPDGGGRAQKIIHQHIRLERGARFAGDDEERARDIDARFETPHLLGIGGVEHMKRRIAGRRAQAFRQHLGAEARAAHAEEQHVGELLRAQVLGEVLQRLERAQLAVDDIEPAEPGGFVAAGPERRVFAPEAARIVSRQPRRLRRRRQGDRLFVRRFGQRLDSGKNATTLCGLRLAVATDPEHACKKFGTARDCVRAVPSVPPRAFRPYIAGDASMKPATVFIRPSGASVAKSVPPI